MTEGSRYGALAAAAAALCWSAIPAPLAAESAEAVSFSLPAEVLDAPPGEAEDPGSASGRVGPDGKVIKGPPAPEGDAPEFVIAPMAAQDGTATLLVGSDARRRSDLLQDPSLSADHGAPDVRLAPAGPEDRTR